MRFISFFTCNCGIAKKQNISKLNKRIKKLPWVCFLLCLSLYPKRSERKHLRDRERLTFESSIKRKEKFLHFIGGMKTFLLNLKLIKVNFFYSIDSIMNETAPNCFFCRDRYILIGYKLKEKKIRKFYKIINLYISKTFL